MKEQIPMLAHIESTIGDAHVAYDVKARLSVVGDHHSLAFTEERESGRVFTTLSFRPGVARVHMKCRGGVKSEMIFDPATPHTSVYELSPLAFDLTVTTETARVALDALGGTLCLSYTREIGGDASHVTYTLTAMPEEVNA